ncbi:hypothetical protein RUND412_009016 [Rhizina undulata]
MVSTHLSPTYLHLRRSSTNQSQSSVVPGPSSLTLRAKSGATTVFLFTEENSSIISLKSQLFALLSENEEHLSDPPRKVEELVLGVARDRDDLTQGFIEIEQQGNKKMTVKAAGLRDGDVVAFKVGEEEEFVVRVPRDDYESEEEEE